MTANKRKSIRLTIFQLGLHASPKKVVEALESQGVDVSKALVAREKAQIFRIERKAQKQRLKRRPKVKRRNRPQQRKIPPRRG